MKAQPTTRSTVIDTICRPVPEYKVVYRDAKLYRLTDSLLKIAEAQLSELKAQRDLLQEKEQETRNNLNRQISAQEQQIALYKEQIIAFEKLWKKERRRRRAAQGMVVVVTGVAAYLMVGK